MRSPGTMRGGRRAALTAAMAVLALTLLLAGCDKGGSYGAAATDPAPAAATQQAAPAAATQRPAVATPKPTEPGGYGY